MWLKPFLETPRMEIRCSKEISKTDHWQNHVNKSPPRHIE
jgi:hypothetical protein